MKTNFIKLLSVLFFIQTSLGSTALAADPAPPAKAAAPSAAVKKEGAASAPKTGDSTPPAAGTKKDAEVDTADSEVDEQGDDDGSVSFSKMLSPGGACQGQEALLNSFINETEKRDANGVVTKYKGKLTEKENEFGDRNFNFEKLDSAIYNDNPNPELVECLHFFSARAIREWSSYFIIMNDTFHCGLTFNNERPVKLNPVQGRTEECNATVGEEKMSDYLGRNMSRFAEVINSRDKKIQDYNARHAATDPAKEKAKTEGTTACPPGTDCTALANGFKPTKYIKSIEERKCCENINSRWASLGFTTVRDSKADDRICKEMIEKDTDAGYCEDSYCVKDVGSCLTNFVSAFAKDFFSSIVDSWKFWAWGDQLSTLIRELKANPWETMKSIAKNLVGFDMEYLNCLNKKSQTQYFCQMVGKFSGSSAGFSAGMGAIGGLVSGVFKGVAARTGVMSKIIAKDPKASLFAKPIKEALNAATKGFKLGALAPLHIPGLAIKGPVAVVKGGARFISNIPKFLTKIKGGVASGVPAAAVALTRVTADFASRTGGESHAAFGQAVKAAGTTVAQDANKIKAAVPNAAIASGEAGAGEVAAAGGVAKLKTLDQVNEAIVTAEKEKAVVSSQLKSELRKKRPERTFGRTKPNEPKATADQPKPEPKPLTKAQQKAKAARAESAQKIRTLRSQLAERTNALEALKEQRTKIESIKSANGKDLKRALILSGTGIQKLPQDPKKLIEDKKEEAPATAAPVNGLGVGAVAPDATGKKDGTSATPKGVPKADTPAAPVPAPKPEAKKADGSVAAPVPGKTDETSADDDFEPGK